MSLTVTLNEQLEPAWLVHVTVVVPTGKNEPEAGLQVTVPQEPVAMGAKVTTAPHWFVSLHLVMFEGQDIVHAMQVLSKIVILAEEWFATARSGLPSRLKSPTAIE